jgi:hypothetical protein
MLNLKIPLRNSVIIRPCTAFGAAGQPSGARTSAAANILLDDLAWWGRRSSRPGRGTCHPRRSA